MDQQPPGAQPPLPPPPPPVPTEPPSYTPGPSASLATPLRRLGARLLDGLIVSIPVTLLFFAIADPRVVGRTISPEDALTLQLLASALGGLYEIVLVHLRGQTVGKMAVGIKVAQIEDGRPPSWNRASIRYGVPTLAQYVPYIGGIAALVVYLWLLWDPRRQGLHDKAARTIVIAT